MKKIIAFCMILVLTCSFIGCGSDKAEKTDTTTKASTAEAETTTEETATAGENESVSEDDEKNVFKVGVIAPLSGVTEGGENMKKACELAAQEINEAGGIGGKMKIELFIEDDKGNPSESVIAAKKLVDEDKVDIVIGAQNSACTLASMQVTQEAEIPQITPASSSPSITEQGNKWIFRTSISDLTALNTVLEYGKEQGWKNVAMVHDSGDFGTAAAAAFDELAADYGMEIVVKEQFNSDDTDFVAIMNEIQTAAPDAVICWGYYSAASQICVQLKQSSTDIPFIGYGFNGTDFAALGGELAEGAIVAVGYTELSATDNALVKTFIDAFSAYDNGNMPEQIAAQTYDTIYLLKAAIESIGVENVTNTALRNAIASISYEGVTGKISFDENGEIIKDCDLVYYNADGSQSLVER